MTYEYVAVVSPPNTYRENHLKWTATAAVLFNVSRMVCTTPPLITWSGVSISRTALELKMFLPPRPQPHGNYRTIRKGVIYTEYTCCTRYLVLCEDVD